jgi:ABC-2 type transport system permease protein
MSAQTGAIPPAPAAPQHASPSSPRTLSAQMYNAAGLIGFILRRDRLWLVLWTLGCLTLATSFAPLLPEMVGDAQSVEVLRETMRNPAMVAICGIAYGDAYTWGVMYSQFMLIWSAVLVAAMNILFVVRHTRTDEEEGRLEALGALPVGRGANLLAVLVVALGFDLAIALVAGAGIAAFGIEGMGVVGSLLFGAAIGACGLFFAAITALFAQLATTSRVTAGLSFAALGAAYLLRATGDVGSDAGSELLSLISPLGLIERCHLFVDDRAWPLLALLAAVLVPAGAAFALNARRDSGAGLIAPRAGRAHASALLRGALGLAWCLTRGAAIAWVLVVFVLAASYGSIFGDMASFFESNDLYRLVAGSLEGGTGDLMDPVLSMLALIMSAIAAVPAVFVVLRLKGEERRGRLEHLLSCAVPRTRLLAGYVLIAVLLAFVLQMMIALGTWSTAVMVMDNPVTLGLMVKIALNYLPAVLFFVGLAAFLVGAAPRASVLVWLLLGYSFLMVYVGSLLNLPTWAQEGTPFGVLPRYPVESMEPAVAIALCAVAAALTCAGLFAYRARDI